MTPGFIILVALSFISATISLILWAAWRNFGRPRHALTWSISFAVATGQWMSNLLGALTVPSAVYFPTTSALALINMILLLIGFRQRAGAPNRLRLVVPAALAAFCVVLYGSWVDPLPLFKTAPTLLFGAALLILSASTFYREGRRPNGPERGVVAMLAVFALYVLGTGLTAAVAPMPPPDAPPTALPLYRQVLLLGLPAGFVGVGLFCVFLLAIDLAEEMRKLAASDPLTGVLNRRGLEQASAPLIAASRRYGTALTVAIADLDRFKALNDRFGHAAGDVALQRFTGCIERAIRKGDLFGRLGGEEFAFVLPGTALAQAAEAMERMRALIADLHAIGDLPFEMTASFGVAAIAPGDLCLADTLRRADAALYQSKLAGRNRVTVAEPGTGFALREVIPAG